MKFFKLVVVLLFFNLGFLGADTRALYTNSKVKIDPHNPSFAKSEQSLSDRERFLIDRVISSLSRGEAESSSLTPEVLDVPGMSTSKVRSFLNNICASPHTNYLEIGCWQGSTFIASLYGNGNTIDSATGVDNWSDFGGPYQAFTDNCNRFLSPDSYIFYSHDCFNVDPKTYIEQPVNIYFYDGSHLYESQKQAFVHFNAILDNVFVGIVDDWNCSWVREGTFDAFSELNYTVLFEAALPAAHNGDTSRWWNGLYVAVIRKN